MKDSSEKKKLSVIDLALSLVFIIVMSIVGNKRGITAGGMAPISVTYIYIFLMGTWIIAARIIRRLPSGDVKNKKQKPKRKFSYLLVFIISLFPIIKSCKDGQNIYYNSIESDLKPLVEAIHSFHKKNDRYPILLAEIKENGIYPKKLTFLGTGPNGRIDQQESSSLIRNRIDEITYFSRTQSFKSKKIVGHVR